MSNTVEKTIIKRLEAKLRKNGKRTNEEVAKALNISEKTLNNYKREACKFTPGEIYKFSQELGCSLDYLYGIDDQEEREVADVCKETGLSAEAVDRLRQLNQRSKHHSWGRELDHAYECKGLIDLISYIIAHSNMHPFYYYLRNASAIAFFKIMDIHPEDDIKELIEYYGLEYDQTPAMRDYGKYLLTTAINDVLTAYEGQVPACIYAASNKITFGQELSDYAADYAYDIEDPDTYQGYTNAYDHIRGIPTFETEKVKGKLTEVKKTIPTAEDWALFKEMTGLTKEDLPGYKEGDNNEKR